MTPPDRPPISLEDGRREQLAERWAVLERSLRELDEVDLTGTEPATGFICHPPRG